MEKVRIKTAAELAKANEDIEEIADELRLLAISTDRKLLSKPIYSVGGFLDKVGGSKAITQTIIGTKIEQLLCPLSGSSKISELILATELVKGVY